MALTIQNLVDQALTILSVLSPGDTPPPEAEAVGLLFLNTLLENWNTQGLDIFAYINFQKPLTAGLGAYTMGNGGAFNTPRPAKIAKANVIFAGVNHPLDIVGLQDWAAREEPGLIAQRSKILYNDNNFPLVTINLHPIPSNAVATIIDLYYWEPIGDSFALTDSFSFPPGYQKALAYNLAVDLQSVFGRQLPPVILQIAAQSKAEIQGLELSNIAATEMPPGPPGQGRQGPPPQPGPPPGGAPQQ